MPVDTKVFKIDAAGNVLWTASAATWAHAFEALLLKDGSTMVATGFGASLDVVDGATTRWSGPTAAR